LSRTDSTWRLRGRTLAALVLIVGAQALIRIAALPRLPWGALCLPQAIALSILLKYSDIPHHLVIAIRPAGQRGQADALHAWIDCGGTVVLGALAGPWHELARLP